MDAAPEQVRVVALYGALRSGTTLFRLLLDGHPAIACPGERDFLLDHLVPGQGGLDFDREALTLDRIFRASGLQAPETGDGHAAFADMLGQEARDGTTLVLILHRRLDRLLEVMPDIPIIHLVRDPRDVARSSIGMGWAGNTWHGVDHWLATERDWDRIAPRMAPGQIHDLRYEDLIAAPEARLAEICAFLGLAYDPAMMSYPETSTYSTIDPSLCYQWKTKQSAREVTLVEHKLGPMLAVKGYAPSGFESAPPGRWERLRLWVQTKARSWGVRFERYGYIDPVLVYLAGKIGRKAWARGAQLRIDRKTVQYLK